MKKRNLWTLLLCCALIALTAATAFATDVVGGMDSDSVAASMSASEPVSPTAALASGAEIVDSGYCGGEGDGKNLTWTLDSEGTLTISGAGAMENYAHYSRIPWYDNHYEIKTLAISNGVTAIGEFAFSTCSNLKSVTIPDSVTFIGRYAFSNCSSLMSVVIPDSVIFIGDSAFSYCGCLMSVTIPGSIASIENCVFSGCGLTSVTIPDSVTSIGQRAFTGCNHLTSVTIPGSVTSIGSYAFSSCGLMSVTILDGVISIGEDAFSDCTSLTSVTVPDSVTSIGRSVFLNCKGLTSAGSIGGGYSYEFAWKIIPDRAFESSCLTSVTIPDSVTSIGQGAFQGCSGLTSITFSDGLTSIGDNAFSYCSGLTSVIIPDSVISIGDSAFFHCFGLTSVTISDSVTSIGQGAFQGCSGLTSVTISASVTSIENSAFKDCTSLTNVTIPDNVTSIGHLAFSGCSSLTSVPIGHSVTSIGNSAFKDCTSLTNVTIPDNVTSIGGRAFENCRGLTSVTIPDSVTSIGSYANGAFVNCRGLTSAGPIGGGYSYEFAWKIIPDYAFLSCKSLNSVTIPDSVTSIGQGAFQGCSGLTSVTIPSSVTSIGQGAFQGCSGLTSVTISDGVTFIGDFEFSNCTALTSVTIPDSVTSIGKFAFQSCSSLTSMTIPNGVISIGTEAFRNCYGLTSVTIPNSVTSIGSTVFIVCLNLKDVYYIGTAEQWNAIKGHTNISSSINIHYESVGPDNPPTKPSAKKPIQFVTSGSYLLMVGETLEITAVIPDAEQSDCRGWTKKDDAVIYLTSSKTSVVDGLLYATTTVQGISPGERSLTVSTKDGRSATCTVSVLQRIEISKDVSAFNADVYRAKWLLDIDHHETAKLARNLLNQETPSHQLCAIGKEKGLLTGIYWWEAVNAVFKSVDDLSTVTNLVYSPIDAYMAIILNTLEEISLNEKDTLDVYFDTAGEFLEQGVKVVSTSADLGSLFEDAIKTYRVLEDNIPDMLKLDSLPSNLKDKLKNFTDDYFEACFPGVHDWLDKFDNVANFGVSLAGDLYSYCQRMASYYALANYGSHIKALLRELQQESQIDGDMYLKIALVYCAEVMDDSLSGLLVKVSEGGYVVGKNLLSYVWKTRVKEVLYKYPLVRTWQTAYKLSGVFSQLLFNTEATADAFAKMQSICAVEAVADRVYQKAMNRFSADKNEKNAALYLASLDFLFVLRSRDCWYAHDYVKALDTAIFSKIKEILGDETYAYYKTSVSDLQKSYDTTHEEVSTLWISTLKGNPQYSCLYPVYQNLLEKNRNRVQKKEFRIGCPVDVYVYNTENQVVAAVANGSVFSIDTIDAALLGEEKIFCFYDDQPYRMEYIGNDIGEMDVSITEFGEDEEATRTVNYYGVKLETGSTYHLDAPAIASTQNPIAYELKDSVKASVVAYDYDSALTESPPHTVKVVSGTLIHEGNSFTSTEAKKGETITLNAYVPAGYEFVRWNVTPTNGASFNATEQSTTLIMPNQDVTVEAVLQIANTAVVRADGAQTETGSTVNAKVCCAGNSTATVYCAFYNDAGKMLSVDIKSANSGENDLSFTTTSGGVATAKLMVLDSRMILQCDSRAVEII